LSPSPNADPEGYPPGVWEDQAGALHFDIEAMVRGAGYEPTPENLRAMERAAHDMAARIGAVVEENITPPTSPNDSEGPP
jgi:hypothetical protein